MINWVTYFAEQRERESPTREAAQLRTAGDRRRTHAERMAPLLLEALRHTSRWRVMAERARSIDGQ